MNKDLIRVWLNVLALAVTLTVNGLANALPLNNLTTGQVSDSFDVFFVPAAYVFSIWGLIYLALLGFIIYQILPAQRENPRLRKIGYWFVASCAANSAWIFLWHYQIFPLTIVAMLCLLASLILIYLNLDINRQKVAQAERWLVDFPFRLYLGWVSVATIANASSLLEFLGWGGWGLAPEIWAVIMLAVGVILAGVVAYTRRDVVFMSVFIWAYIGIAVAQKEALMVVFSAWLGAVILAIFVLMISLNMLPTFFSKPKPKLRG